MKKFFALGILAVFTLFLPSRSQAVPLDVPYQLSFSTFTNAATLVISTTGVTSAVASVNANAATYQWCLERCEVTTPSAGSFSISWSTSPFGFNTGTTDYMIATGAATPYALPLNTRTPYCAPVGATAVTLKASVAGSTVTVGGFLYKGWNP